MNKCPWCGESVDQQRKLCPACYRQAVNVAAVPPEEFDSLPYGIIELDETGKIIAFNKVEEDRSPCLAGDVIGLNFFREVAPCTQVVEYEGRFRELANSDRPSEEFSFIYPFPQGPVRVHIVMVRTQESWILIVSKEMIA
jgi:photoactive yellow protein